METEYGTVKYIYETSDATLVYVYDIYDNMVRASFFCERPYLSLLRANKNGRQYFLKKNRKIYIDELEELHVIWGTA